ncbi:HTH 29 domain containing protein [Asbolus verrucosus]|uniref:HTH 29 domain containing protein n=1 Tax=Asbolus verrucosus TaxID=1661398 RepID=A0A482VVL8_ASBVE|nr:HTH 29 domain containing protein [Asbolus verrucosus]
MPRRHLSATHANQARDLLENVWTQVEVAARFRISQSVISRLSKRYSKTGPTEERSKTGRPRITIEKEDRLLITSGRRDSFTTVSKLPNQIQDATETSVSMRTVRNRLYETIEDKDTIGVTIVLSGEKSGITLSSLTNLDLDFIVTVEEVHPLCDGSVIEWDGIFLGGCTELHICSGNMNAQLYTEEILGNMEVNYKNNLQPGELGEALPLLWDNLPQYEIDHLLLSMPRHCREVIDRRGGRTYY